MVDANRRYVGAVFIALNSDQREQLWSRVWKDAGGVSKDGPERLRLACKGSSVAFAEMELRHANARGDLRKLPFCRWLPPFRRRRTGEIVERSRQHSHSKGGSEFEGYRKDGSERKFLDNCAK